MSLDYEPLLTFTDLVSKLTHMQDAMHNLWPTSTCQFLFSSQLTLSEGTGARFGHSITSYHACSGLIHTTTFGGSPKFERGKSADKHQKKAETIVMEFGE